MGRPLGSKNHVDDAARLRSLCRAKTEQAVRALAEALEAMKPIVSEGVVMSEVVDHDVRIKAAQALLDRGYGKPEQAVTGKDGGAIKVDSSAGLLDALKRLAEPSK